MGAFKMKLSESARVMGRPASPVDKVIKGIVPSKQTLEEIVLGRNRAAVSGD